MMNRKEKNIGRIEFGFGFLQTAFPVHSDNFFELHYVYKGRGRLIIGETVVDLHENLLYISPPDENHYLDVNADASDELLFHIIRVRPSLEDFELWNEFCFLCKKRGAIRLGVSKRYEIERIRELSGIDNDNARKAAWFGLQSILYEIFIPDSERKEISGDDKIQKIIRYLEQHIQEKIKLGDLASLVFMTPTQVSRMFQRETGISPMEFFLNLKIDKACFFLSKNDFKNRELAEMFSFSDEFHFSKVFKKKTGMNPATFRKKETSEKEAFIENLLS